MIKYNNCFPVPKEIQTRAKSGAYCALSGEWFGKSNLTPKEVSEASYRVVNVMMEARSKS